MQDEQIVDLYWSRSEDAIPQTAKKHGKLCYSIAFNILNNAEDAQECVNDTYLKAWNSMPDERPNRLAAFLCRITRNLALDKRRHKTAKSRGSGQMTLVLDELGECVSGGESAEDVVDKIVLEDLINRFLGELSGEMRDIFVLRYWFLYASSEIARRCHISESKVNTSLFRMRKQLKAMLEKEELL